MAIFTIEDAERKGARLLIGLCGPSGSGKTFSALQLAHGLANYDASKIGFIDTESRRGRLYANILKDKNGNVDKFKIGDMQAPFSPDRYVEAIQAFVDAGVEVIVIDSLSHSWNGQGGCEDIATGGNPKNPRWNVAKQANKRMVNAMLQAPCHVIVCLRAQEKVKLVKGGDGKIVYEPLGLLPICEKNLPFEMTASMLMHNGGREREVLKSPSEIEGIFGVAGQWAEGYITAAHGKQLRDWVAGAEPESPVQRARDALSMACEGGFEALKTAWTALPAATRKAISPDGSCPADLKASAQAFDAQRIASNDNADADNLNAALLSPNTGEYIPQ